MAGLEIAVLIGVALIVGGYASWRLHLPAPLVLLVIGIGLGFVRVLGDVALPPDVVLFLFLPVLLFWEAVNLSGREVKRNLRVILLSAIPLVLVTAAVVAVVAHLTALPWAVAITLGAVLAPTDATAVEPVAASLPRRMRTILQTESLINDGTALTLYAIAVSAVSERRAIEAVPGVLLFVGAYAGGIAVGVGVAFLILGARRLTRGRMLLENTVNVLTPFLAYLPAQWIGASGVLSVVACGFVLSHYTPRTMSARTRVQARGFWELTSWVLNGALFLLVGLQARRVLADLGSDPGPVLLLGLAIALVVVVVRLAWGQTTPYLIRAIDRRPVQRTLRVPARQRTVSGWAGFRGAVSLAAALALPVQGAWVQYRAELIAITLVVIVVTLAVQGLTMPAVIRWARLPQDPSERDEERTAELAMGGAAAAALDPAVDRLGISDEAAEPVRRQYAEMRDRQEHGGPTGFPVVQGSEGELRRALIQAKRDAVVRLRDTREIDESVMRRMIDRLDLEELRLSPQAADD